MKSKLVLFINPEGVGCRYQYKGRYGEWGHEPPARGTVTIIAKADGYFMVRYPRMIPFVVSVKELRSKAWEAIPTPAPSEPKKKAAKS